MALIRTNGGASAAAMTVTTSERQSSTGVTIDLTNVKYVIFGDYEGSVGYVYVYDVDAGTWNVSQSKYNASVSGNTMTVSTNGITYYYYVTIG